MPNKKILISGASIAGPTLAYWLNKYGFEVTIIERAESLRLGGQSIDIKGTAHKIANMMGIEGEVRAENTGELGVLFLDKNGKTKATLAQSGTNSFTSELEILRGTLAKILFNATKENVKYIFGNQITEIIEDENCVNVSFKKGENQKYDLVICADGIRSKTRKLIFGNEPKINSLKTYMVYFTIQKGLVDDNWARWFSATEQRVMFVRPDNEGTARASFSFMTNEAGYENLPWAQQREILQNKFKDAGWQAEKLLAELDKSEEVYFDNISQVKAPKWWKGRCAMTGDAAYCASPFSGMGASLAMIGAYILAGELSKNSNHEEAFAAYEKLMRPYAEKFQKLPPGTPILAHPKSKWGALFMHTILNIVSSKFVKSIGKLFEKKNQTYMNDGMKLPDYFSKV
jgi:2-polyprenyl-6-methoxyphenol hydroxylase-like FAD-dependent oxidoreductase